MVTSLYPICDIASRDIDKLESRYQDYAISYCLKDQNKVTSKLIDS